MAVDNLPAVMDALQGWLSITLELEEVHPDQFSILKTGVCNFSRVITVCLILVKRNSRTPTWQSRSPPSVKRVYAKDLSLSLGSNMFVHYSDKNNISRQVF